MSRFEKEASSATQQLLDYGRNYGVQTGEYISALGRGAKAIGLDSAGQAIANVGDVTQQYWKQNITPETQQALAAPYIGDNSINVRRILMDAVVDPANAVLAGTGRLVGGTAGKVISAIPNSPADLAIKAAPTVVDAAATGAAKAINGYGAIRSEINSARAVARRVRRTL